MLMVEKALVISELIRLLVQNYFVLTVKKAKKKGVPDVQELPCMLIFSYLVILNRTGSSLSSFQKRNRKNRNQNKMCDYCS